MAKKALLTVGGTYHKIKKGFITVDSTYHKIKKAFITIGGAYRPCWGGDPIQYYGTVAYTANGGVYDPMAISTGSYALFGGGTYKRAVNGNVRGEVTSYNSSLTQKSLTAMYERWKGAATAIGNYAIFAGGRGGQTSSAYTEQNSYKATADYYNKSLTRYTHWSFLSLSRSELAATTVGNYALFGGGQYNTSSSEAVLEDQSIVDTCTSSLTIGSAAPLSVARSKLAATTVGSYALFGGGYTVNGGTESTVDAYDTSLTRSTPTRLSDEMRAPKATTVGDYAIFTYTGDISAYNKSLVRSIPASPSYCEAATTLGGYALLIGQTGYIDIYDASLTHSKIASQGARDAGASVGNYALFAGNDSAEVLVYTATN